MDMPPIPPLASAEHKQLTPEQYAATLGLEQREYRERYMSIFKGCKGYCVAGSGGNEPRSGQCPSCHAI